MIHRPPLFGVSLFTCTGIGDAGFRAGGVEFIAMSEIRPDLAAVAATNFPDVRMFVGDIRETKGELVEHVTETLRGAERELDVVSCTAPCQGMSKNGRGTLLRNFRKGKRPKMDPRNRLILPALEIIVALRPRWVVFENVIEMRDTLILDDSDDLKPILDVIRDRLPREYVGEAYEIEFADYGVPQRRQRLITVYTRDPKGVAHFESGGRLVPEPSHDSTAREGRAPWVSVTEALREFPPLDASSASTASDPDVPMHRVPVLDEKKYEWIRHAGRGKSAFDNQCVNPSCGHEGNATHGAAHDARGVNRARTDTPLYCEACGSLLPRPCVEEADGTLRIMKGYTSAYKRMDPDLPAPALTRNLSYPCSDQKVHPTQNRVLSLAEAMRLQTLDAYDWKWGPIEFEKNGKTVKKAVATDTMIRLALGESIPPAFLEILVIFLQRIERGETPARRAQNGRAGWLWPGLRSTRASRVSESPEPTRSRS